MDRPRTAGLVASGILLLIAALLALVGGDAEVEDTSAGATPRIVTVEDLAELEDSLDHPIYWVGDLPSRRLELAEEADGSVYLRYLPEGAAAGDPRPVYLTVGTYPVPDAEAALARTARDNEISLRRLRSGAVLLANPASRGSVYLAYPGADLQIEVYDPEPGRARELIEAGAVRPVGE